MQPSPSLPWYQRTYRWGQTNLSEHDPSVYDVAWWRAYWRRTQVQGVIVNAGGIVAYYPSRFEFHQRAALLGERDLFGEIAAAAREEGLTVVARMDSNRASEPFYRAHPDWFSVDAQGRPNLAGGRYVACLNSPYTRQYLPEVLREVIERYAPDGFADNSWSGPGRDWICHCIHCQEKFAAETGLALPSQANWDDPCYRRWVRWSYACRTEVWDMNNQVTQSAGGADCLWAGMVNGYPFASHLAFCDLKAIAARAQIFFSDQQSRRQTGFEQNSQSGQLLHGLLGWDKLIPESMAQYVHGGQAFRKGSAPPLEARKWMVCGLAGGLSPWWHHVGAFQEDRRQFRTAQPVMEWHAANEDVLYQRQPAAAVGVLWSHENADFYGRERVEGRVGDPWRGVTLALTKARIPYLPVHADQIARAAGEAGLRLLILPDLAVMSEAQCRAVRQFVEDGQNAHSLLATGCSSLLDEDGLPRPDFALGDLFGVRASGERLGAETGSASWDDARGHNYLRLAAPLGSPPDSGAADWNALSAAEGLFYGFEEVEILPFGGTLQGVEALPGSQVLAAYVPAFPIYPPETSWMRQPATDRPVIVARQHAGGGRVVYFAGDIDRCYGRRGLPDHGALLANAARWALGGDLPFTVTGPGYVDAHLYRQARREDEFRLILHLVNLSGCSTPGYLEEHLPVGPLQVAVKLPPGCRVQRVVRRVAGGDLSFTAAGGQVRFEVPLLVDHEVVVVEAI